MKKITFLFLSALTFLQASAQKLHDVQQVGVRVPSNIKIDGNLSEWNGKLEAHNPIDGLMYTVSNDSKNLYLTLLAPWEACRKAIRAGITFSVSKLVDNKRRTDPELKSVTFPLIKNAQVPVFGDGFAAYSKAKTSQKKDSLLAVLNKKAASLFKIIGFNDEKISVYNEEEILTAIRFNQKRDMIYELCIPLKLLGLNANHIKPFSYNIKLNGESEEAKKSEFTPTPGHPTPPPAPTPPKGWVPPPPDPRFMDSDFWGVYTLVK